MKKNKNIYIESDSPTYTIKLLLATTPSIEQGIERRFRIACMIYNIIVNHCRKQYNKLINDKDYQSCFPNERKNYIKKYGLREYDISNWAKPLRQKYKKYLDSHAVQDICKRVFNSVNKVLYDNGKEIHHRKLRSYSTICVSQNTDRLRYENGKLLFDGLVIKIRNKSMTPEIRQTLSQKENIKYASIKREFFNNGYRYYAIIYMKGKSPFANKLQSQEARVGIDIGTSTVAMTSEDGCLLEVLAPLSENYLDRIADLQEKMDRSLRSTNPDCYNQDGTVIKGSKFKYSKNYNKLYFRLRDLYRRCSLYKIQSHNLLAKNIIGYGKYIYIEDMDFRALSRRVKGESILLDNGKYKKKKRYGKSILNRCPGLFVTILERKLCYLRMPLIRVNTKKFKASQYNHVLDSYEKKDLSVRSFKVDNADVQRDLYSAFLLMNSNTDFTKPDKVLCDRYFNIFLRNQEICLDSIRNSDVRKSLTFGL